MKCEGDFSTLDLFGVTGPGAAMPAQSQLVLSLFPGIDLLGRGFEAEGFSVVRGPDLIFGGDIRAFSVPAGRFDGVIGGSPCQDFSRARRVAPTGEGAELLVEFFRVVSLARPSWWLLENVPSVPDVIIDGYSHLRIDLHSRDCGMKQSRLRHFQFGHISAFVPVVTHRSLAGSRKSRLEPCCMASEGLRKSRRSWSDFCELQGLPRSFDLPGMTLSAKYKAVGNGVPVPMARVIAAAIRSAVPLVGFSLCLCGCGRVVQGRQLSASPACRKRLQRKRFSVTQLEKMVAGESR